jgi:hypothetical protein
VRRLALAFASGFITLLVLWTILEVTYRLGSPPSYVSDPTLVPDAALGWNSVPAVQTLPGGGDLIIYLGDSFTQGRLWPVEAQRLLAQQGIATNGSNLGVSGYGTTQALLKLGQHIAALKPRAIVLLFFAWNDLRDNFPYPEIYYGPQRTSRPYLITTPNGPQLLPVRWASSLDTALLHSEAYLRVFNRASLAINARIVQRWPDLPRSIGWRARLYYEQPVSWQPFYKASEAEAAYVRGAYDSTMEAMRGIRIAAEKAQAALLVIGIDNSFTVDADDQEDFLRPHPELDPSLPMKRMAQLLGHEQIAFINAQPELAALRARLGRDVYNGPRGGLAGHLGEEGDRLIGQIAARWLATALAPH